MNGLLLLTIFSCGLAQTPDLTLARDNNWRVIQASVLAG